MPETVRFIQIVEILFALQSASLSEWEFAVGSLQWAVCSGQFAVGSLQLVGRNKRSAVTAAAPTWSDPTQTASERAVGSLQWTLAVDRQWTVEQLSSWEFLCVLFALHRFAY